MIVQFTVLGSGKLQLVSLKGETIHEGDLHCI